MEPWQLSSRNIRSSLHVGMVRLIIDKCFRGLVCETCACTASIADRLEHICTESFFFAALYASFVTALNDRELGVL